MLVFALSLPPVTTIRPSGSTEMPGQNMSCPVSVTVRWVTTPVAGSYVAVTVRPRPPLNASGAYADQVRILPLGSCAAATGTSGKPTGALHVPRDGTTEPLGPSRLISAALLHGPRLPASDSAVSRTYRAVAGGNTTVCRAALSGNEPAAIRDVHVVPSVLLSTLYRPMRPLALAAGRGR